MTRTIDITSTYCLENSKNNKWNSTLKTYNNNLHGLVSILEILYLSCNDVHCLHWTNVKYRRQLPPCYLSSNLIFNF